MASSWSDLVPVISPELGVAAYKAGLKGRDLDQIQTWDKLYSKHRELLDIKDDATANATFNALDPSVQDMLKQTFNANYAVRPKDWTLGRVVGNALSLANPIRVGAGLLTTWTQGISALPAVGYAAATGQFTPGLLAIWRKDWDGKKIYDRGATAALDTAYGAGMGTLARGIASGMTPGEIITQEGGVNPELETALNFMYDQPDKFKEILGDYKRTQFSVGRFAAKGLFGGSVATPFKNTWQEEAFDKISGVYDATFQVAADPLTYMTAGFGPALKAGTKLAKMYEAAGSAELGVKAVFEGRNKLGQATQLSKDLNAYWDDFGQVLKNYKEAKTPAAKDAVRREIATRFSAFDNDKIIQELIDYEDVSKTVNGVFDANSAKKFFSDYEKGNPEALLSGRTNSMVFYRDRHIATANKTSIIATKARGYLDNLFNKPSGSATTDPLISEIAEGYRGISNKINSAGQEIAELRKNNKAFRESENEIKSATGRISKLGSRAPLYQPIEVSDDKVLDTIDVVNQIFRVVHPKRIAGGLTEVFKTVSQGERVALLRGAFTDILHSSGLGTTPKGIDLINEIIGEKFITGEARQIKLPDSVEVIGSEIGRVSTINNEKFLQIQGPIHPNEYSDTIGNVDWHSLSEHVSKILLQSDPKEFGGALNTLRSMSSIVNGKWSSDVTNFWSVATLVPKLGVRGTVDELFFFANYAPKEALYNFFSLKGLAGVKINAISKKSDEGLSAYSKYVAKIQDTIPDDEVKAIFNTAVNEAKGNQVLAVKYAKEELVDIAFSRFTGISGKNLSPTDKQHLRGLFINSSHFSDAISSVVAGHMLGGISKKKLTGVEISTSKLSQAFKELGFEQSSKYMKIADDASRELKQLVHYDQFYKTGAQNSFAKFGFGLEDPINYVMRNNGLKTPEDFNNALNEIMTVAMDEANEVGLRRFIDANADVVSKVGHSDYHVMRNRAEAILYSMRETLHGTTDYSIFNSGLIDAIIANTKGKNFANGVAQIDRETFFRLTKDNIISTEGRLTNIVPVGTELNSIMARIGNNLFEFMDRQIMSMYRAPAFISLFLANMDRYKNNKFYQSYIDDAVDKMMSSKLDMQKDTAVRIATSQADQYFTEISARAASDLMMKYVDNPQIRSQLAFSMRNGARFYRATEDFIRRMYRMKDVSLRSAMRMRLSALGLEASGIIHEDSQGQKYVVMPMDDAMFQVIDKPIRALTGGTSGYMQPLFGDFTIRLSQINPSFGPDAAMPTLSGPIASANVWLFKTIAGRFGATGREVADVVDNALLGNIGDNLTLRKALVPASLDRVFRIMNADEKDRQEVTAIHQAIAYDAAHGKGLSPTATPEERYQYIKNIRISAHNVIVMRNLLGLMPVPFSPTLKESKDVPNFLKEVGISTITQEFYDIYENVLKAPNPRLDNPYEEALAIYIGKNPGKLVYTVSRADKTQEVAFNKTEEVKKWYIRNKGLVDKYGEVAWLAAPNTGEFSSGAYAWFEAAGMLKNKDLETYLKDVQVAEDKALYFDVEDYAREQILAATTPETVKQVKANMQKYRDTLLIQNPLLKQVIESGQYGTAKEEAMLNNLTNLLMDPSVEMDSGTRVKLRQASEIVNATLNKFLSGGFDANPEYKREVRDLAIRDLEILGRVDSQIRQANKAVFFPILKNYSKDVRLGSL